MNRLLSEQKINDRFLLPTFFNEKNRDNPKNERVLSLKGIYSLHCVIEKDIVNSHQEQSCDVFRTKNFKLERLI